MRPCRYPGQPVLIVGLPRCGTSYLASFLRANGVNLGGDLSQAGYINPRGFFEERTIVNFHKRQLTASDRLGAQLPLLASSIRIRPDAAAEKAANSILDSLARPGLWGWKDPRTLLFLDFWLELLPNAKLIVPIRHPLDNYWSYWKRIRVRPVLKPSIFFAAYARQTARLLEAAKSNVERVFVLDAGTAYRQPDVLRQELDSFFDFQNPPPAACPIFHKEEFSRLPLTERTCEIFAQWYPRAAGNFQELNDMARFRFEPRPGSSRLDPIWAVMGAALARMVR